MFSAIFSFELRRLMRSGATYIYFGVLLLVTFFIALMAGGVWPEVKFNFGGERIHANAPMIIDTFFSTINNYIGLIIMVAIIGNAVLKDFKYNTHSLIFTTPISKFDYLAGRFSATLLVALLVLTGPAFGLMLGYAMPWVQPDRLGVFQLMPYVSAYWQSIVPNTIIYGTIFFAVSLISRDIFVIWLSLIVFFVANGVASSLFRELDLQTVGALADPMGNFAKRTITKYWSTWDKNHRTISLQGYFLLNRLIWLAVAAIVWFIGYSFFSFSATLRRLSFKKVTAPSAPKVDFVPIAFHRDAIPSVSQQYTTKAMLGNLWGLAVNECITLWRNAYFRIILLFGMLLLFLVSKQIGQIYETQTLPVTYEVVEYFFGTFQIFIVILTILFGGELVWRAREFRMSNILDALPVPNWVFYISKLAGLWFMQILLVAIVMVCGIAVQLTKGYMNLELGLYVQYLFIYKLPDMLLLAVLSIFVQTLSPNKFLGYFIVAIFYFWNTTFAILVLKHNLLIFGSDPGVIYSAMNKFGHATFPFIVFKFYWGAFCLVLALLSSLLWARGSDRPLRLRWAEAWTKQNRTAQAMVMCGLLLFAGIGAYIYYNTNVLNSYQTNFELENEQAVYEKKYSKYKNINQPKITDIKLNVDLHPYERGMNAKAQYMLQNKSDKPIDSVHLVLQREVTLKNVQFQKGATLVYNDSSVVYHIYRLAEPLLPGDSVLLSFDIQLESKGFAHSFTGLSTPIYNGTFINNRSFMPSIGYNKDYEIADNNDRKKHGLAYRPTANKITDSTAWQRNLFTNDADFVGLDVTVSTVPAQIAVAPGYLQREWQQNGRRYFHYKMDSKILNFYSILSAEYTVRRDKWKDVNIEIFYTKGHEYNLDRMIHGIKKSLDYYTTAFSPYQHKQVRILEFPRYSQFAQSFPNTIPFSEGIGFIANVDTAKADIDYPFYVTAHEVAHQWFAHQVVGADVEGSNILSESLAQYGSIRVMEKEYGEDRVRKFLRMEMDKYLSARSSESEKEKPWALADDGQSYILYQKGGILTNTLCKYIGEDSMNAAVSRFILQYAFKGAPYPTTAQLVQSIKQSTPDSLHYLINDAFYNITLYNNAVTAVKYDTTQNGGMLQVDVSIQKLYADGVGKETPAKGTEYVELAIYKDRKTVASRQLYKLNAGKNSLSIPLSFKPYKVALDPRLLLIDKKLEDNEMKLAANAKK